MSKYYELQSSYAQRGFSVNRRAGVYYITRRGKPLQILKRYSPASAGDVERNIAMLNEFIDSIEN